jgi:iron complex transport system substrate-binding protein
MQMLSARLARRRPRRVDKVVGRQAAVEVDMAQHAGGGETLERAIDGGAMDRWVAVGDLLVQHVGRQVLASGGENARQQGNPWLCHALPDCAQHRGRSRCERRVIDRSGHNASLHLDTVEDVRIVSLLPSTTEILFAVGAGDHVVGVTFECDHPTQARSRQVVSTTTLTAGLSPAQIDAEVRARIAAGEDLYRLDEGALRDLEPDLVLTQDLCAVCAIDVRTVDAALLHLGCTATVLTVDPQTLSDVLSSIVSVGVATDREPAARALVTELSRRLDQVRAAVAGRPRPRVAVVEWTDPPFTSGHWVPDMVQAAGAISALGHAGARSTQTSWDDVRRCDPDLIVVAPCGYRLPAAVELATGLCESGMLPDGAAVWAVDADAAFVRPGPRLVDGIEALAAICHPGVLPPRPDLAAQVAVASMT